MISALSLCHAADAAIFETAFLPGPDRLATYWREFEQFVAGQPRPRVYGVTTLPGHRMADETGLTAQAINQAIFSSHLVGGGEGFSAREIRHITLSKIISFSHLRVAVSPALVERIVSFYRNGIDENIFVPKNASYSCGDVVPAAHWLSAIVGNSADDLGPGEVMAMINGNFISLGASCASILPVARTFAAAIANEADIIDATNAPREMVLAAKADGDEPAGFALEHYARIADFGDPDLWVQLPVSIRSFPQLARMRVNALAQLCSRLNHELAQPSGNPFFDASAQKVVSQASFLCLDVSIALDGLISAILAAMWNLCERLKFLVEIRGEQSADNPIWLIQIPKMVQAELETARALCAGRAFVSGGSTSSNIEDFWGFTLLLNNRLSQLNEGYRRAVGMERLVLQSLGLTKNSVLAVKHEDGIRSFNENWMTSDQNLFENLLAAMPA